eukprot:scaffold245226_cov41-Prasinocladus_malaysianus.AAC.1
MCAGGGGPKIGSGYGVVRVASVTCATNSCLRSLRGTLSMFWPSQRTRLAVTSWGIIGLRGPPRGP